MIRGSIRKYKHVATLAHLKKDIRGEFFKTKS